jgi:GT2 family glycosyltransferase
VQKTLKGFFSRFSILINDWARYELNWNRSGYLQIKNRLEKLAVGPIRNSYVCLWPYTSRIAAVEKWPFIGKYILKRVCRDNEFILADERKVEDIEISVIIGHRGLERIELLIGTLKSLAGQKDIGIECIVVEQDSVPRIEEYLPKWVKYFFQEVSDGQESYNRSAAFNHGARHARGQILLLHDNDMIVPTNYCSSIKSVCQLGYTAINIKRFVFYLSKEDSDMVLRSIRNLNCCTPLYIVQNLEAGGSVAITKVAYNSIGGMDESFVGWGGEDNEFWERCGQLQRWIWGFSPVIHLWHQSQPLKHENINKNVERAKNLKKIRVQERTEMLKNRNQSVLELMERSY